MLIGTRYLDPAFDFDADPDPAFYYDTDPDPTFLVDVDPGPNQINANVRPLVYRPFTASFSF
jgi:hypothetical protein